MSEYRIGHGYDVHRLVPDRPLILGGVQIEHPLGLLGHSDADVLLHAMMDAVLGALGLGDIGAWFPDTDNAYLNIDSKVLLSRVYEMMAERGGSVVNMDATLVLQSPRVAPYLPLMRREVARLLHTTEERIHIKATTEEHLGFTGREEGIAAHAVVLLSKE